MLSRYDSTGKPLYEPKSNVLCTRNFNGLQARLKVRAGRESCRKKQSAFVADSSQGMILVHFLIHVPMYCLCYFCAVIDTFKRDAS